jgi:hypothetical protein
MWFPHVVQRLPMSFGDSDGQLKIPSVTGTWVGIATPDAVAGSTVAALVFGRPQSC